MIIDLIRDLPPESLVVATIVLITSFVSRGTRSTVLRKYFLSFVSLGVVASIQPTMAICFPIYCFFFYKLNRLINESEKKRVYAAVLTLIAILIVFKYGVDFLNQLFFKIGFDSVFLVPLGISYFVFKTIHYVVETSRGTIKEHNFLDFFFYLVFFPTFFAGPITLFEDFKNQNIARKNVDLTWSIYRICVGLIKKIVIAQYLVIETFGGSPISTFEASIATIPSYLILFQLALYYLYCYFDFAALSDIAIGVSGLLGFKVPENFNFPIAAKSIGEFWQKWHMSLSNFCKYYIYFYVLGYTRSNYCAFLGTMLVIALWHGLTWPWFVWGLYQGTGLYLYLQIKQIFIKKNWSKIFDANLFVPVKVFLTFLFVALGYTFVGSKSIVYSFQVWGYILGLQ